MGAAQAGMATYSAQVERDDAPELWNEKDSPCSASSLPAPAPRRFALSAVREEEKGISIRGDVRHSLRSPGAPGEVRE